jgi:hypothetical protein
VLAAPTGAEAVGGGGGVIGAAGAAGALADEAGDPQTLQKEEPSDTTDPHFEQNAIFPPVRLGMHKTTQSIAQKRF